MAMRQTIDRNWRRRERFIRDHSKIISAMLTAARKAGPCHLAAVRCEGDAQAGSRAPTGR